MAEHEQKQRNLRQLVEVVLGPVLGASLLAGAIGCATWLAFIGIDWRICVALVGLPVAGAVVAISQRKDTKK